MMRRLAEFSVLMVLVIMFNVNLTLKRFENKYANFVCASEFADHVNQFIFVHDFMKLHFIMFRSKYL